MSTTGQLEQYLNRHEDVLGRLRRELGTPLHVVFLEQVHETAEGFQQVLRDLYPKGLVAFAVKSNPCRGAVRMARRLQLGADAASENEFRLALEEGIPPGDIICNGNAKSAFYLQQAVAAGCLIAVDNQDELTLLEEVAAAAGRSVDLLLRFRGMPLSGLTSADQSTAADWTKFGFHINEADRLFKQLRNHASLRLRGVSAHIGTQIAESQGYERLFDHMIRLCEQAQALGIPMDTIDLGGGFPVSFLPEEQWTRFQDRLRARMLAPSDQTEGITWNDQPMGYAHLCKDATSEEWIGKSYWSAYPAAEMLRHLLSQADATGRTNIDRLHALGTPRLIVEPGRSLMASAGVTLTQVVGTKQVLDHDVVSLDMGINNHGTNLISPDLFPAAVWPRKPDDDGIEAFLAGRLCFSGDMISKAKVPLNRRPTAGERFVLFHTGAYGADHFASRSCGFLIPAKVALTETGTVEVWRRPESFEQVFGSPEDSLTID